MPVETPSGRLLPTDEYAAIYLSLSDQPTMQLPALPFPAKQFKSSAQKKPTGIWRPPADATECHVQHSKLADQSRTYFGVNGRKYTIESASCMEFCMFLEEHGYDTCAYSEPIVPGNNPARAAGMVRRDAANALLDAGRLRLLRTGEGSGMLFYLAPPRGCKELANEMRWKMDFCCSACHSIEGTLAKHILTDRREVMLCCRASRLLADYPHLPQKLPPCDQWDGPVDDPGWDDACLDD